MTQEELARKIGVTQGTISRWFTGTHKPSGLAKKILLESHPKVYDRILGIYNDRKQRTNG